MATQFEGELARFYEFIGQRLNNQGVTLSPEEALDLWRAQQPPAAELVATVAALREALVDMDAGDTGQPFDEFIRELRQSRRDSPRP